MVSDQMRGILRGLPDLSHDRLTAECSALLGVDGVAVSLALGKDATALLACSPGLSACFEDLQFALGEGPGPEAVRSAVPVRVSDLGRVQRGRWPVLVCESAQLGVRAAFSFPLAVGGVAIGSLTGVRSAPDPMTVQEGEDALGLAAALTLLLVGRNARRGASWIPFDAPEVWHREEFHEATGMLSVQLGVPLTEAALMLRAVAYSSGRSVRSVSEDVVARRLRLGGPQVDTTGCRTAT